MKRNEFMEQLRRLLYDIPEKDREEALEYYESYFDDAGEENEDAVIRELGSPGRVAAEIKAGLNPDLNAGEYTDTGYHDTNYDSETEDVYSPVKRNRNRRHGNGMDDGLKKLLLIVVLVLSFPIWGTVLGSLFSVVMGALGILIALIVGSLFGGIGITIVSIVLAVVGIIHMVTSLPLGITMLGGGMILLALGILLLIGFGWFTFKVVPALVRFILEFIGRIFHRNRREEV